MATTLNQHLRAVQFINNHNVSFYSNFNDENCPGDALQLEPAIKDILPANLDSRAFNAYFSEQLTPQERKLLVNQTDCQFQQSNDDSKGDGRNLPTPSQLDHIADVLGETVRLHPIHCENNELTFVVIYSCRAYSSNQ